MMVNFSKYHGTGNDFILINGFQQQLPDLTQARVAHLCHRHFGVGADGLIVLKPGSFQADFHMDYYNADGNPGSMCGNGGRCAARFAADAGIVTGTEMRFSAFDGMHQARLRNHLLVELKMAPAGQIRSLSDTDWFTDTGSPHLVRLVSDPDAVSVFADGRKIRYSPEFAPGGTNVNFVAFRDRDIRVRTYERGVENETLSCGTGVVASALVVGRILGRNGSFRIQTPGGNLEVVISPDAKDISLTGPAMKVFDGTLPAALPATAL